MFNHRFQLLLCTDKTSFILAFFVNAPKFDRIADAEEQIKAGSDYLNKGNLDMVCGYGLLFKKALEILTEP